MGEDFEVEDSLAATSTTYDSLEPPSAFKATKLADGRVLVQDVPVFAECDARYTPDGKLYAPPIGLPWLKGAFAAFEKNPGYWAPIHGDHHSGGVLEGVKDRERFGEFRARSVRMMRVEGKPTWVFTADYLFDDEEKAKKSNRFPYQSVEIVNEKPDEINSVALLSDKAPFVRFPNRRVAFEARGRRVCYATIEGRSADVWQSFTYAPDMAPEVEAAAGPAPKPETKDNSAAFAAETEEPVADDKKPDEKKIEAGAGPPPGAPGQDGAEKKPASEYDDLKKTVEALAKDGEETREMVAKLAASMGSAAKDEKSAPEVEAAAEPGSDDEKPAEMPAKDDKKARAPVVAAQVQFAVEVDSLKAKLESMERSKKHDEAFATFAARLEPFGLTTGRKQRLETFLANDLQYGTTFAEQYVKDTEAREKRVSRPSSERGPDGQDRASGDLPVEVRAYATQGAPALAWAQAKFDEFRSLEAAGCTGDMTLKAFLAQSVGGPAPQRS